ncbi:hypothetical protein [Microbacterium phyllosphaerae]|uniref:hypothetical protein n=1 Tax=Microbacterium phyllosphaerae TaxID=124798 RepID=UPI002168351E|nr:hypothetical protein [Microbacterium phyllosphaerae]MCS3442174.1 hypothetical protein [Microbacterium phyllosphaerae]
MIEAHRPTHSRRTRWLVAAATVLTVSLTGCAAAPFEPADPTAYSQEGKDRGQWVMPFNKYYFPDALTNYAENIQLEPCLVGEGYDWPVPWEDPAIPRPEDLNAVGYRLFDERIAARWGYHVAPSPNTEGAQARQEFFEQYNGYNPDDRFDEVFDDCLKEARDDFPADHMMLLASVSPYQAQAEDAARMHPDVAAAIDDWRVCLTERVHFDVPDAPWDSPSEAMAEEWGFWGPEYRAEPSVVELRAAVADAECRESSGFTAAYYDANWNEQQRLIDENRVELDAVLEGIVKLNAYVRAIIDESAPPRP